ncbi:DUF6732 family protein [Halovulum sp. GXIMD14793]
MRSFALLVLSALPAIAHPGHLTKAGGHSYISLASVAIMAVIGFGVLRKQVCK